MTQLYWYCETCGAVEDVEPTGGEENYALGDREACTTCEEGVAKVTTSKAQVAEEFEFLKLLWQREKSWYGNGGEAKWKLIEERYRVLLEEAPEVEDAASER